MTYYSIGNVVYNDQDQIMCVVAPIWFLGAISTVAAKWVADCMNECEYDSRDVMKGSLH